MKLAIECQKKFPYLTLKKGQEVSGKAPKSRVLNELVPALDIAGRSLSEAKFNQLFSPIPHSLERIREEDILWGDVYETNRKSGEPLTIVPTYIKNWRSVKDTREMLMLFGFDTSDQLVGLKTLEFHLIYDDSVYSAGALSSVIANDGIGSALEVTKTRVTPEVIGNLKQKGWPVRRYVETIDDFNRRVLNELAERANGMPESSLEYQQWQEALAERHRWETLFQDNASRFQLDLHDTADRGLASDNKVGWRIDKNNEGWTFENLGTSKWTEYQKKGYLDKNFLVSSLKRRMHPVVQESNVSL